MFVRESPYAAYEVPMRYNFNITQLATLCSRLKLWA
jgi:hypothetical protein